MNIVVLLFCGILTIIFVLGAIIAFIDWINRTFYIHKFVIGKRGAGKERIDK